MSANGGHDELSEALRAQIVKEMGEKIARIYNCSELGDAAAAFLAAKLRGNTVAEHLWLLGCRIGAVGARALAETLAKDNTTLKSLELEGNKLGDDGAESMAQMLRKNKTLEELRLGDCGVGDRGARALGVALLGNTSLKYLDLGNDIGDGGAEALAEALRGNESLKKLALSHCQLTAVGASSLVSALRESNSTLRYLYVEGNSALKHHTIKKTIWELTGENRAVQPASAERRARCLLFCCLHLAPTAHEHAVPSLGAVPVPVMQYAVEHAAQLHVAKRFEADETAVRESSAGVRARSSSQPSEERESAAARRRR